MKRILSLIIATSFFFSASAQKKLFGPAGYNIQTYRFFLMNGTDTLFRVNKDSSYFNALVRAGSIRTVAPSTGDSSDRVPTTAWVKQQGYGSGSGGSVDLSGVRDSLNAAYDSIAVLRDSINVLGSLLRAPVLLDETMKNDEDGLGLDWTNQNLLDSIAKYGGGDVTTAQLADSTEDLRTLIATKAGPTNITATTNGSDQVTIGSSTQTNSGADFPAVTNTTAGILIPSRYNRSYTRQTATWSTGTVTVNINNGGQVGAAMSASGGRTLAFSNLVAGDMCKISMNNTSGGTITLTLPSNSFVQNTTTGVYESAASVTVPSGRTILTLTDFDGTNYLFVY